LEFLVSSAANLSVATNNEIVATALDSCKRIGGKSAEKWTFVLVLTAAREAGKVAVIACERK